jgi:nucleoid DNA-binding protein
MDGAISGLVWVIGIRGEICHASRIHKEFNSLIIHLKFLHVQFMKDEIFDELNSKETLSLTNLFQWLHNVLMTQERNNLPLFGNFELRERESFEKKPLDLSEFSEVQIVLMDHFSNLHSNPCVLQLALYLLGYWYKENEKDVFTKVFINDQTYWKTALKTIKKEIQMWKCL